MIDTGKVTDRRSLKYSTPDELLADVERLIAAERDGTLRRVGNWTLGQNLGHLASWIEYPYTGYPPELKAPWFIRAILKFQKKKFMRGPLRGGVRIPGLKDGTVGIEVLSTEEGVVRYRRAWERLRKAPPGNPNPVFGRLTHEEWVTLHLRHAELHLGYLHAS